MKRAFDLLSRNFFLTRHVLISFVELLFTLIIYTNQLSLIKETIKKLLPTCLQNSEILQENIGGAGLQVFKLTLFST